jgi:hypothetical protein
MSGILMGMRLLGKFRRSMRRLAFHDFELTAAAPQS